MPFLFLYRFYTSPVCRGTIYCLNYLSELKLFWKTNVKSNNCIYSHPVCPLLVSSAGLSLTSRYLCLSACAGCILAATAPKNPVTLALNWINHLIFLNNLFQDLFNMYPWQSPIYRCTFLELVFYDEQIYVGDLSDLLFSKNVPSRWSDAGGVLLCSAPLFLCLHRNPNDVSGTMSSAQLDSVSLVWLQD